MSDRSKNPTQRGHSGPVETTDDAATEVFDGATFPRRPEPPAGEPIRVVSVKAQHESGPVAISMKTPMEPTAGKPETTPMVARPKLRAEITPLPRAQPRNLGYLAPPRDPAEARSRRVRDLAVWSSVSVIVASIVALVIWFLAR